MLLATAAAGCAADSAQEEDLVEVDDTKADDYYSNVSFEFEVRGAVKIKMTDAEYADATVRKSLVERRLTAVGLYLTAYVTDKLRGIDINDNGTIEESEVFFRNEGYGGFHAMVRTQSGETGNLKKLSDGIYELSFELDLAGPKNLTQLLPRVGTTAPFKFELKMPEFATVDPTAVPRGEIRNWKPETATGPVESDVLALVRLPTPRNAYPQYAQFVSDGVYDITMVFGYDYNTPRSDVSEIKETYEHLIARGFESPVTSFDALKADSGPFTLAVKAGGKPSRWKSGCSTQTCSKVSARRRRRSSSTSSSSVTCSSATVTRARTTASMSTPPRRRASATSSWPPLRSRASSSSSSLRAARPTRSTPT